MAMSFGEIDGVSSFGIFYLDICSVAEQQADERALALARRHVQRRPTLGALRVAAPVRIGAGSQQQLSAIHAVVNHRRVEGTASVEKNGRN